MKKKAWHQKWQLWLAVCFIVATSAFVLGFYKGEKIYIWFITPFRNSNGAFDYGIFWTAIGAMLTASIAFISVWQTRKANETNSRLLQLEESKETPVFNLIGKDFFIRCDNEMTTQQLCFKIAVIRGTAYAAYIKPIYLSYSEECFRTFFADCVCKKMNKNVFNSPLKAAPLFIANVWEQLELTIDNPIGGELLQNLKQAKVVIYKLDLHYIRSGNERKRTVSIFYSVCYDAEKGILNLKYEDYFTEKEEVVSK